MSYLFSFQWYKTKQPRTAIFRRFWLLLELVKPFVNSDVLEEQVTSEALISSFPKVEIRITDWLTLRHHALLAGQRMRNLPVVTEYISHVVGTNTSLTLMLACLRGGDERQEWSETTAPHLGNHSLPVVQVRTPLLQTVQPQLDKFLCIMVSCWGVRTVSSAQASAIISATATTVSWSVYGVICQKCIPWMLPIVEKGHFW